MIFITLFHEKYIKNTLKHDFYHIFYYFYRYKRLKNK